MDGKNKYVIGLTGNIATGKSLVRRMLECLGVFSIDTDSLGHRLLEPGCDAYKQVIRHFGSGILDAAGSVDRSRLAGVVFSDPQALARLEAIIHPPVFHATDTLIQHAAQPAVVLESIILLETELLERCDNIWVVSSSRDVQIRRLTEQRGLSLQQAILRIDAQAPQEEKISRADVVIRNDGDVAATWEQVQQAFLSTGQSVSSIFPSSWGSNSLTLSPNNNISWIAQVGSSTATQSTPSGDTSGRHRVSARIEDRTVAWIGLRFENLLCLVDQVQWMETGHLENIMNVLAAALPEVCQRWQCEASLVAIPDAIADLCHHLAGFSEISPESLPVTTWREHAIKLKKEGMRLFYRQYKKHLLLIGSPSHQDLTRD